MFDLAFQEILAYNIAQNGNALHTQNGQQHLKHHGYYSLRKIQYSSKHASLDVTEQI